jgi:electron transport complex protein RnfE
MMSLHEYKVLARDGLWDNNAVLAQRLALCPALAITTTATNGLGMGIATTMVLIITNAVISVFRNVVTPEVRIPVFILLIATIVTVVDLMINAFLHSLYTVLGLFIPLIVTNCVILGRAEAFASRNEVLPSAVDGLMMGVGFTAALTVIGAIREIIGSGTLFANASSLLGSAFSFLELVLIPDYKGYLIMMLPPGGFIVMGFLMAAKQVLEQRAAKKAQEIQQTALMQQT